MKAHVDSPSPLKTDSVRNLCNLPDAPRAAFDAGVRLSVRSAHDDSADLHVHADGPHGGACYAFGRLSPTRLRVTSAVRGLPFGRPFDFLEVSDMATTFKETTALRGLRCRACAALQPADDRYVCGECLGPIEPEYDLSVFDTETLRAEIERGPGIALALRAAAPGVGACDTLARGLDAAHRGAPSRRGAGHRAALSEGRHAEPNAVVQGSSGVGRARARARARARHDRVRVDRQSRRRGRGGRGTQRSSRFRVRSGGRSESGKIASAAAYGATVVRVRGSYDAVNRLCGRLADEYGWGFVNFTLRPYYAEGSKTLLFEMRRAARLAPARITSSCRSAPARSSRVRRPRRISCRATGLVRSRTSTSTPRSRRAARRCPTRCSTTGGRSSRSGDPRRSRSRSRSAHPRTATAR